MAMEVQHTDQEHANRIQSAVATLNDVVREAAKAGLEVTFETFDLDYTLLRASVKRPLTD